MKEMTLRKVFILGIACIYLWQTVSFPVCAAGKKLKAAFGPLEADRKGKYVTVGTTEITCDSYRTVLLFTAPSSGNYSFTISNLKSNRTARKKDENTLYLLLANSHITNEKKPDVASWPKWNMVTNDVKIDGKMQKDLKISTATVTKKKKNLQLGRYDEDKYYATNTGIYKMKAGERIVLFNYGEEEYKKGFTYTLRITK